MEGTPRPDLPQPPASGKAVLSNDHWFKPAMSKAGIADFKWHDLRHTFASWLVQDGVPLERVAKLLGHKTLTMANRYAHLAPNQLYEDISRISRSTTIAPSPESLETEQSKSLIN